MSVEKQGLRSADFVMSPGRAGSSVPTPLSFSRKLLRKMVSERWLVERPLFDLDAEGRGQALYRIVTPGGFFHFFVVSDFFPPEQKLDRAFGVNWDVSAAICEGEWTEALRQVLGVEVPKQYDGRYPECVLCFCRGNRSERVFDHVVDSLAAGIQPDPALLASVGYLLRSTAFAGNGLFGIKPFEALDPTHPLGDTYDVQILSAYLLRIFVFDLVEHIAAAKSPASARLDPDFKRYLGVGNSAGLGLVPFIMNHPRIIHQWVEAQEAAFAEALERPVDAVGLDMFRRLVCKARTYFAQDLRDGGGIFTSYDRLTKECDAVLSALGEITPGLGKTWRRVIEQVLPDGHDQETEESLLSLLLELFPDIVARYEAELVADEDDDLDPSMTTGELAAVARRDYGWLLDNAPTDCSHFWYYPFESPYEPRRGIRGTGTPFEVETPMDLPRLLPKLVHALEHVSGSMTVGEFLAAHPEFTLIARRVQSLVGYDYAELRVNTLSASYLPFAACRFLLAFYGMEKFDPRLPRSTKGALLQGAPLPEEIAAGRDGSWPYPLAPASQRQAAPEIVPQRLVERPDVPIDQLMPLRERAKRKLDTITVFPAEMRKLLSRAVFGAGFSSIAADTAVRLAVLAADGKWIDRTLDVLETGCFGRTAYKREVLAIEANGLPDFAAAATVLDLACALANERPGKAECRGPLMTGLADGLALWGARRGYITALTDYSSGRILLAGGEKGELWAAALADHEKQALTGSPMADLIAAVSNSGDVTKSTPYFAVACIRRKVSFADAEAYLRVLTSAQLMAPSVVRGRLAFSVKHGFHLSPAQFERLSRLAKRGLVSPAVEPVITGQAVVPA